MGVRLATATAAVVNAAASLAAETILFTTNPIITAQDGATIFIFWYLTMTIGTGGTAVTLRLRQGTLITGTVLNTPAALTVTAGSVVLLSGNSAPTIAGQAAPQFSLTAQVTGATVNSPFGEASLFAFTL